MTQPLLPRQLGVVMASVVLLSLVWAYLSPMAQARQEMDQFSHQEQAYYENQDWEDETGDYYEWVEDYGLFKDA